MSDGGSRGSTQLSISLVRPCPDGYTGIRRAEIMLKVEPANHPFVVPHIPLTAFYPRKPSTKLVRSHICRTDIKPGLNQA